MREKYFAFIVVMLAATVAFILLTTRTLDANMREIRNMDDRIKTTQEQLNSARIMDQELSQFARIIDNSLTRTAQFSFEEINEFKATIGRIAHERQISINKLSDTNKWSLPNLIETTFNLELEANYVQIGQFISDLESQDNIIKIQTLDISPAQMTEKNMQAASAPSRYRVILELSMFKVKKEV